jgi:hypothetical protein
MLIYIIIMCLNKHCISIEIIQINNDGDMLYLHYKDINEPPFFIQFFGKTGNESHYCQ